VRAGNVIGPGDYAKNRLLPDILCGLRNGSETQIRNPDAIRPWQYVLDPLIGYLLVGYKVITNKPLSNSYNFGPTDESFVSVRDLVTKVNSIRPIRFSISQSDVGLESKILKIDSTLAQKELAWKPKTNLETALKYSIELNNSEIEPEMIFSHIENYLLDF
jgi:CDP-glucose 4,6-dehydratase